MYPMVKGSHKSFCLSKIRVKKFVFSSVKLESAPIVD